MMIRAPIRLALWSQPYDDAAGLDPVDAMLEQPAAI